MTAAPDCQSLSFSPQVYAAEHAVSGLADRIRNESSFSLAAIASPENDPAVVAQTEALLRNSDHAVATNLEQLDLFYLKSVLVSTGMNKNDDFFERNETWAARSTPSDKPFNYEHKSDDIIGHITECRAVDAGGASLPDGAELPDKFHLLTTAVVYRRYPDAPERQKRTDRMVEEIGQGKWYVSMECLFKGFDYLLVPEDSSQASGLDFARARLVSRAEDTAFLTKHLRAYGGSGRWNGHRVGRVLKNILFSGKGLVRQPANPESVIFTLDDEPLSGAAANFCGVLEEVGYGSSGDESPPPTEEYMTEIETLKADLVTAKSELAKAQSALKDHDNQAWVKQVESLKAEVASAKDALAKAETALKAETEKAASAAEAAKVSEAAKATAETELAKVKAEKRKNERVAKLKDIYGDKAEAMAASLDALSDENFDVAVNAMAVKVGESKVSNLEAPMGGGAKPVKTIPSGAETIPPQAGGTKTATAADLDSAVKTNDAALATAGKPAISEFEQTQADILAYFGGDETESDKSEEK